MMFPDVRRPHRRQDVLILKRCQVDEIKQLLDEEGGQAKKKIEEILENHHASPDGMDPRPMRFVVKNHSLLVSLEQLNELLLWLECGDTQKVAKFREVFAEKVRRKVVNS